MAEAQELACIIPVLERDWENRTIEALRRWRYWAGESMALQGTVVSPLRAEVAELVELGGIKFTGEDEDGNTLPPFVQIRYTAMAVPHKDEMR